MKISSMLLQLISLLCLLPQFVQSTTILVDGVSEWKDPSVHVGDTVSGGGGVSCSTDGSILCCNSVVAVEKTREKETEQEAEAECELHFV
ncbi:Cupredoxin superfamily protein isoform 1 [Tripterygium wilfordii]|uniref:Cupredoxin superfamily protein isoform 1 n=1 Tax=Tripterygium wilfordii TaxID=458696 RepID=A0A7J7DS28_TRIWF|nr:Cupredoxin superfamily protein isoform 1 [Tripterygium wilfordii]